MDNTPRHANNNFKIPLIEDTPHQSKPVACSTLTSNFDFKDFDSLLSTPKLSSLSNVSSSSITSSLGVIDLEKQSLFSNMSGSPSSTSRRTSETLNNVINRSNQRFLGRLDELSFENLIDRNESLFKSKKTPNDKLSPHPSKPPKVNGNIQSIVESAASSPQAQTLLSGFDDYTNSSSSSTLAESFQSGSRAALKFDADQVENRLLYGPLPVSPTNESFNSENYIDEKEKKFTEFLQSRCCSLEDIENILRNQDNSKPLIENSKNKFSTTSAEHNQHSLQRTFNVEEAMKTSRNSFPANDTLMLKDSQNGNTKTKEFFNSRLSDSKTRESINSQSHDTKTREPNNNKHNQTRTVESADSLCNNLDRQSQHDISRIFISQPHNTKTQENVHSRLNETSTIKSADSGYNKNESDFERGISNIRNNTKTSAIMNSKDDIPSHVNNSVAFPKSEFHFTNLNFNDTLSLDTMAYENSLNISTASSVASHHQIMEVLKRKSLMNDPTKAIQHLLSNRRDESKSQRLTKNECVNSNPRLSNLSRTSSTSTLSIDDSDILTKSQEFQIDSSTRKNLHLNTNTTAQETLNAVKNKLANLDIQFSKATVKYTKNKFYLFEKTTSPLDIIENCDTKNNCKHIWKLNPDNSAKQDDRIRSSATSSNSNVQMGKKVTENISIQEPIYMDTLDSTDASESVGFVCVGTQLAIVLSFDNSSSSTLKYKINLKRITINGENDFSAVSVMLASDGPMITLSPKTENDIMVQNDIELGI